MAQTVNTTSEPTTAEPTSECCTGPYRGLAEDSACFNAPDNHVQTGNCTGYALDDDGTTYIMCTVTWGDLCVAFSLNPCHVCTEPPTTSPPTKAPTIATLSSTVSFTMSMSGMTDAQLDANMDSIESSVASVVGVEAKYVTVSKSYMGRRFRRFLQGQTGTQLDVEIQANDPTTVETVVNTATFATDVAATITASTGIAVTVTEVSEVTITDNTSDDGSTAGGIVALIIILLCCGCCCCVPIVLICFCGFTIGSAAAQAGKTNNVQMGTTEANV